MLKTFSSILKDKPGGENMKKTWKRGLFIMLVIVGLSLTSSAIADEETQLEHDTIVFQGLERTFFYYVPDSYNDKKKTPLMFSFHGSGSDGPGQAYLSEFEKVAEKEGFIVVYPSSIVMDENGEIIEDDDSEYDPNSPIRKNWNSGGAAQDSTLGKIDDVGFTSAVIDYFMESYNIDATRVYASGMSNGAAMANRLGVELSERIAGIAAVTGGLSTSVYRESQDSPIPVVLIMGDDDPVVPYAITHPTVNYWIKANEIKGNGKPKISYLPQQVENDPTKIRREAYLGGKHGTKVVLYTVEGGGHTWPSGPQYLPTELIGLTSHHINASEVIWSELRTHKNNQESCL